MKKLFLIISFIFLAGCAGTGRVALEAVYIDTIVKSGIPHKAIISIKLSDAELIKVTHAFNRTEIFRQKYRNMLKNPSMEMIFTDVMLQHDYTDLKKQYHVIKEVVQKNWNRYYLVEQIQFRLWLHRLESLDKNVDKMIAEQHRTEAIRGGLSVAATILSIAAGL